ncbi:MAG TPA: hypothetical protein VIQ02_01760, partial [Jiangellaceae bacterium]
TGCKPTIRSGSTSSWWTSSSPSAANGQDPFPPVAAREDDLGGGAGWPGLGVAPTFPRGLFGTAVTRAVLQALQVIHSGGQAMTP